jgi:glycosyltransferase involved in cell wall biosynthesis
VTVSFCLPTYNRAEYLAESIDSCLAQSHADIEVVVVDDGSSDSTPRLLEWYAAKDPRVRFVRTENRGIAAARNLAVSLSRGKYVAVMDSDDLCGPDRISRQVRELEKGFDVCYSSYLRADENASVIDGVKAPAPREITRDTLLRDQGIPHVTVTARRECFLEHPYDERHAVNDDYALVVSWVAAGYRLRRIQDPLMIVRFHTSNTSRTEWERIKEINEEVRDGIRSRP